MRLAIIFLFVLCLLSSLCHGFLKPKPLLCHLLGASLGTWLFGCGPAKPRTLSKPRKAVCALAAWTKRGGKVENVSGNISAHAPSGIPPAAASRYAPVNGTFLCLDGSQRVPVAMLNDDFCDCDDGSDEPGTAACNYLRGRCFYCPNSPARPKFVYSSRVGDGICDCCDGSDEAMRASSPCHDTCQAQDAALRQTIEARRAEVLEGMRMLQESREKAAVTVEGWKTDKDRLKNDDIPKLDKASKEARELEASVQKKFNEERVEKEKNDNVNVANESKASDEANEEEGPLLLEEDFEGVDAADRWKRADGGSGEVLDIGGPHGKVLAMKSCTYGGDTFSLKKFSCTAKAKCRISFKARGAAWQGFSASMKRSEEPRIDAHSWLAVPKGNNGFKNRLLTTLANQYWKTYQYDFPASDEFDMFGSEDVRFSTRRIHIMFQAHASTGFCDVTMFDDIRIERLPAEDDEVAPAEVDRPQVSEYAKWALDQKEVDPAKSSQQDLDEATSERADKDEEVKQRAEVAKPISPLEKELEDAKKAANDANTAASAAKKRLDDISEKLKVDLGEGFRWFSMVDSCPEKKFGEYLYSICFFKKAKQDGINIGKWHGWESEKPLVMKYTDGSSCPGGITRSLTASLVCGPREEIISVSEPSRCAYKMDVMHFAACGPESLQELDQQETVVSLPHDEL